MEEPAHIGGRGGLIVGIIWAQNVLALALISARFYTRKYVKGQVGWDDICLIITWFLMSIFAAFVTAAAKYGLGQHRSDISEKRYSDALLMLLCSQFVVCFAIGMAKVVVALFLIRIVTSKWQQWFLWFCIASITTLSTFMSIVVFAQCTPVEAIWTPSMTSKMKCSISLTTVGYVVCSYAAAMDFILAGLPWVVLRRLNMKRKERITICISLSLGVFAGICGIIRTSDLGALESSQDYLYAVSNLFIWTATEVNTTIICVVIPALRPLYKKMRGQDSTQDGYQQQDDSRYESYPLSSFSGKNRDRNNFTEVQASRIQKNGSDETILLPNESNNIMKVQEVTVVYEEANQGRETHSKLN